MSRVLVHTAAGCPFCRSALALLDARGVPYDVVDLTLDEPGRAALAARTGRATFPQILADGEPVGGFQELAALDRAGGLAVLAAPAPSSAVAA